MKIPKNSRALRRDFAHRARELRVELGRIRIQREVPSVTA
jgi:hypothetical protein